MKCSSGTSCESLERISAPEKQISIGWKPLSSSVAFSSFKQVRIGIFYSYFCFAGRFQVIFAKVHQKITCKDKKAFKDTLGVPLKCLYHRYDTPYSHRKHKSKIKDFSKIWHWHWRQNPLLKCSEDFDEKILKNGEKSQKSSQKCRKTILYPKITSRSNMESIQIKWASKMKMLCPSPIFGRFGRRLFTSKIFDSFPMSHFELE